MPNRNDLLVFYLACLKARLVITPATANSPAVMEDDDSLRERAQMAWEGLSSAGARNAYIFHARSASGRVADASVHSPAGSVRKWNR